MVPSMAKLSVSYECNNFYWNIIISYFFVESCMRWCVSSPAQIHDSNLLWQCVESYNRVLTYNTVIKNESVFSILFFDPAYHIYKAKASPSPLIPIQKDSHSLMCLINSIIVNETLATCLRKISTSDCNQGGGGGVYEIMAKKWCAILF